MAIKKHVLIGVSTMFVVAFGMTYALHHTANPIPPRSFAYITKTTNNEYHRVVVRGATTQTKKENIGLSIYAPDLESDYLSQSKFIDTVIDSKKFNGIIIAPNHSINLLKSIDKIEQAGIDFVVVDTPISIAENSTYTHYCGFVGTDNVLGGKLAAQFIAKKIKTGNVVLVRGVASHRTSIDREKGFLNSIRQHPNIKVIAILDGEWQPDVAISVLEKFQRRSTANVNAIFAYNDPMALAIAEQIKLKNLRPILVGYNGDKDVQKAILAGKIDASVVQTPELMGRRAVEALLHCNRDSVTLTPVSIVTAAPTLATFSKID